MSRSFKHKPFMAVTGNYSAHDDKTRASKGVRRTCKRILHVALKSGEVDVLLPHRLECTWNNTYSWGRDGHQTYQVPDDWDWQQHYLSTFDPTDVWFGDKRFIVWPPQSYVEMMRK